MFALAAAITSAKGLREPGRIWTARIKARDWSIGTSADWQAARDAIARLDQATGASTDREPVSPPTRKTVRDLVSTG